METLTVFAKSKDKPVAKLGTTLANSNWFTFPVELVSDQVRNRDFTFGKVVNVEYYISGRDRIVTKYSFVDPVGKMEAVADKEILPAKSEESEKYSKVTEIVIKEDPIAATITDDANKVPEGSKQYSTVMEMVEDLSDPALVEKFKNRELSQEDIQRYAIADNKSFTAQALSGNPNITPALVRDIYDAFRGCNYV